MKKYLNTVLVLVILLFTINFSAFAEEEYTSIDAFQDVIYLIKNYYVEDVKLDKLMRGAIKGMVDSLDPYSGYLTPEEYEDMQFEFEGHYGGIGIVISTYDDKLTVVQPFKNTPGDKAGLKSGDIIVAIDGKPTKDMPQEKAVNLMRGKPGTRVILTIKRENKKRTL